MTDAVTEGVSDTICDESSALKAQDLDKKFLGLAEALKQRVLGQDEAVTALSEALLRSHMEVSDPNAPLDRSCSWGVVEWEKPSWPRHCLWNCMAAKSH